VTTILSSITEFQNNSLLKLCSNQTSSRDPRGERVSAQPGEELGRKRGGGSRELTGVALGGWCFRLGSGGNRAARAPVSLSHLAPNRRRQQAPSLLRAKQDVQCARAPPPPPTTAGSGGSSSFRSGSASAAALGSAPLGSSNRAL